MSRLQLTVYNIVYLTLNQKTPHLGLNFLLSSAINMAFESTTAGTEAEKRLLSCASVDNYWTPPVKLRFEELVGGVDTVKE